MIIEVPGIKDERLEETAAHQVEETDLWPLLTLLPSLLTLRLALSDTASSAQAGCRSGSGSGHLPSLLTSYSPWVMPSPPEAPFTSRHR